MSLIGTRAAAGHDFGRRQATTAVLAVIMLAAAGCGGDSPATESVAAAVSPEPPPATLARARELAHSLLLVDTHIDLPSRLHEKMEDVSGRTESGDFDHSRALQGGLDAPFMSIYIPSKLQEEGGAAEHAEHLMKMVEEIARSHPDLFGLAPSTAAVRQNFRDGRVSLPMGMENGAPVATLESLAHYHQRGIRYITLTHGENNQICDSSYASERQWNGLSPFGRQVVAEMNRLGIIIDASHISDATFEQVMELSAAPVIASHSSCRAFTPGFERNMSDTMISSLAAGGGVIHINFGSSFLREDAQKQSTAYWALYADFLEEKAVESGSPEALVFEKDYWQDRTRIYADVRDVADHIDHVVRLVGIEHVGIGSDFDGVGDSLPSGLKDVSGYPNLLAHLLQRGYSEADLALLCGENLMRVWAAVEATASRLTAAPPLPG